MINGGLQLTGIIFLSRGIKDRKSPSALLTTFLKMLELKTNFGRLFLMKYVFPAVLTYDSNDKVYLVDFPDAEGYFGCSTFGHDLYEALDYAEDAINLMLCGAEEDGSPIPQASDIHDIIAKAPKDAIVTLIKADTEAYAKEIEKLQAKEEPDDDNVLEVKEQEEELELAAKIA